MSGEYKPISLRPATAADVEDILRITREAFAKYAFDLGRPELVYALKDSPESILADIQTKRVYLASLGGEAVGTIRYEGRAGTAFISRFGVTLKAQSCGVGGALIHAVLHECQRMRLPAVTLHTSARMASLIRFYYGQGFYIRTTDTSRGYVRALLVRELVPGTDVDIVALKP